MLVPGFHVGSDFPAQNWDENEYENLSIFKNITLIKAVSCKIGKKVLK
jgi:hypothetical protein